MFMITTIFLTSLVCLSTAIPPLIRESKPIVFDQQLQRLNNKALERHNYYRDRHGVGPIVLNSKLATLAHHVAEASAKAGKFVTDRPIYSGVTPGAMYASMKGYPASFDGGNLTDMWYWSKDENGTRNYGQVIWKDTKQAGFGFCKSADGQVFYVGLYYPPGNVAGFEDENILPLINKKVDSSRLIQTMRAISRSSMDDEDDEEEDDNTTSQSLLNKFFITLLNKLNEIKIEPELAAKGIEWIDKISNKLNSLKSNLI